MIAPQNQLNFDEWKDIATILYRVLYASAIMGKEDLQLQVVAALGVYEDKVQKENE